ncbi:MAG TPA: class I SAM-dependent methyltransferase [Edaphobacter sp.]|jgi:hypothetical protein|nr:class I SAM-dependent methyltransferase [Edaphobacter sp.]
MSLIDLKNLVPLPLRRRLGPLAKYVYRNDLNQLARHFQTDKWGDHWYTQHYQRYFKPIKNRRLNLLEIGVGGYEDSTTGGESLRMWKTYFPKSKIVGIDLCDKSQFREHRIDIRQCDQTDANTIRQLSTEYGGFDIIIDDGSHLNEHVITTFQILFPLLRPNGIYSIEDTQTSYWPGWGGGMNSPESLTTYFKNLSDGLNHVEYPIENYIPDYFDRNIVEIAFFHNLIIVRKGNNDERANAPQLVRQEIEAARAAR